MGSQYAYEQFDALHAARKELWKRALRSRRITLSEIDAVAPDPDVRALLIQSLQLAGVEIDYALP